MFLQENNFLIRYNACHERNWSDSYIIMAGRCPVGYGSVKGRNRLIDRDAVFEFYALPAYRNATSELFRTVLHASDATFIECQSNDFLLSSMLYEFSQNISSDVILFKDYVQTELSMPDVVFRKRTDSDTVFEHHLEPAGEYVLEREGEIVATGGFMLHYNIPFADLYMEVREDHRRKGLASYLLQEIKKECYHFGRVPAGRCNLDNHGSRGALLRAGLTVAGYMLAGTVKS